MKHWEKTDQAIDRISPPLRLLKPTTLTTHTLTDTPTTQVTAAVTGPLTPKPWRLPTNVSDRTRETTTHSRLVSQSVIFLKLLSVELMHTVRQAPRMLTLCIKWQTLHSMLLQLHNTPLHEGTLMWQAVTLSSIHSFGPHRVLIIVPCYRNGIMLFTIKIVNHTTQRHMQIHYWYCLTSG